MSDQANEINDVSPSSLRHFVAQPNVVAQVAVALEASFADGKKFDHALLVGPPGVGKTQMAHIIAQEKATELHEILGQSVKAPGDLNAVLLAVKDQDVVHIDECHEMKKEFQTSLYRAVENRKLFIQGRSSRVQSIPLNDFTLLLTTARKWKSRSRFSVNTPCSTPNRLTALNASRSSPATATASVWTSMLPNRSSPTSPSAGQAIPR